ncbi:MAG: glycosyltransferase family 2 protein [Rhizobiales bacterium]|nr:glycosyltransferase family 2 protein [Hyphomicrobiales bacterium]
MIADAVESCLRQSYPHLELVLVDDCSDDDLEAALRPWKDDPRVRLLRHERNRGVSAARNTGVVAARGDYVAFLDSDDAWLPEKLERQLALALQQDDPTFIIGTLTRVWTSSKDVMVRPKRRKPAGMPLGDYLFVHKAQGQLETVAHDQTPLLDRCFAQTSSWLLPTDLARATPFRADLSQYEDMAFLIDLDDKGAAFLLVEEPLTLQQNDDRPGRLGSQDDLQRGLQFLDAVGGSLSPAARLGFEAAFLGHQYWKESPLRALSITFRAFAAGAIGPKTLLGVLSRCLLGQASQRLLRGTLRGWFNRSSQAGQAT